MSLPSELEELEQCRAYVLAQLEGDVRASAENRVQPPGPAVAISPQCGSGAHAIARQLGDILQRAAPPAAPRWTVFDHDLVETVIAEHHLPKQLARHLSEERRSYIREVMEELVGLYPPSWLLAPQIAETILHLVNIGHVILVGWGASVITRRMPNVFHVRIIASLPKRTKYIQQCLHLSSEEAARVIEKEDRGRGAYVKTHFHQRVDDDLMYDLVINTDAMPHSDAAALIAEGARRCFQHQDAPRVRGRPLALALED